MNNNLQLLYKSTLSKYKKFKSRFDKNVDSGHFYEFSSKTQHQIISRLERLKRRLIELKTQLKLALVSGALVFCLATTTTQGQQIGPFVQNNEKSPFPLPVPRTTEEEVALVDLDGDGDFDVVVGRNYGDLLFFENIGTPTLPRFINRTGVDNPFNGIYISYYASPAFADLDGDGDFDLFLGTNRNDLAFFENTGDVNNPQFSSVQNVDPTPVDDITNPKYYKRVTFTDIDGDGDLDIFTGENYNNSTNPVVTFWLNDGTNNFTAVTGTSNPLNDVLLPLGDTITKAYPTFVDIDNDGDQDAFIGDAAGNILFFRNEGTSTSPSFPAEITGASNPLYSLNAFSSYASPEFVDLDNDGDFDLVLGTGPYGTPKFFRNDGSSSVPVFNEVLGIDNPFEGFDLKSDAYPTSVDIDGDGFLDIVIGERNGKTLHYFANNQDGTFTEKSGTDNPFDNLLGANNYRTIPSFADIDNDGDQDLFVALEYTNGPSTAQVNFYRNDGSNNFVSETSPISSTQNYTYYSITVDDFDKDGDYDVIIGGYGVKGTNANFLFVRNDGTEISHSFVEQPVTNAPFFGIDINGYAHPVMVDLDHDGDTDVVTGIAGSSRSGELLFFRNFYGSLIQQTAAADPFNGLDVGYNSHPTAIDFDNDGDLDLLVGDKYGQITLFENQNEPPHVTAGPTPITFTEGDVPISLHPSLDITDDGNDLILGATVQIQNYVAGEDVLTFDPITNPDWNISAVFETTGLNAGTLMITGLDTLYNYRTVLRSVKYQNTSISPNTTTRNIRFAVTDFDNTDPFSDAFPEPIIGVNIIANNSTPTVSASATAAAVYTENTTPGVIIDAAVTVSDIDNTSFQSATISITNNFNQTEDALVFSTQNGITGNYVSTTGILTLSGTSSVANYQTALRSVRYINNSEDPSTATRTIEFSVFDGTDNSAPATRTVQVVAVNDAPVLSSSSTGTLNYDQNTAAILVDDMLSITDVDNANIQSVTVTINGYQSGDVLSATPPAGITSNFDTGTGILSLSGSAPIADYITAAVTTSFSSSGTGTRQIEFLANDGTDNSNLYSRQVTIIVNVAPVLSSNNAGTGINYTQNKAAVVVDNQLVISDTDDTNLESVSISITSYQSGDLLTITPPPATTSNFDNGNGILTVSGSATLAEYQTAIRTVAFSSSNGAGSRTIAFIGNDGDDDSNTYNRQITISNPSTIPPVVNTTPSTTQVGSTIVIDLCNIISDPDNTFDELTIIVVSILSQASTNIAACDLTIDYSAVDFEGEDSIVLRATDPDGNSAENTLTITVEPIVTPEPPILPLEVFNAVSPNGDGLNDTWRIKNLLQTPNSIKLFNRWGDLVKTINDYVDPGDSKDEIYIDLSDVPAGTYFYKIESVNGKYTGYITIKK